MRWRVWVPFAVLCLLAASRWMLAYPWPEMGSTLRSEAWACGVGAVVMCAAAVVRRRRVPAFSSVVGLMGVGAGLLGVPALGAALHGPAGSPVMRTVALCFVPVVVTVLSGVWGDGVARSLWPGLAGLGGALLVFPLVLPSGVLGWAGLVGPVAAVSVACVWCRSLAKRVDAAWGAGLVLAGGAVCLVTIEVGRAVSSGVPAQVFSVWAVGIDLVLTGLVVAVVLQMDGLRYAARYFAIPLLTVVENLVVDRAGMSLRLGSGGVLLAWGAVMLLRSRGTEGGTSQLHLE